MTRNELVKTWGRDEPNRVAVTGGAEDDATVTRTTVKLDSSRVQQTDGDVPALQEREVALNMARGLETSRTCGIPPVFKLCDDGNRINRRPLQLLERIDEILFLFLTIRIWRPIKTAKTNGTELVDETNSRHWNALFFY